MAATLSAWKVGCPTCGHVFPRGAARWRDYASRAPRTPCPAMAEALRLGEVAPELPPDQTPGPLARLQWGRRTFFRNTRRWKKVCPHCRVDLPSLLASGDGVGERFAIIGSGSTGKSQLIYAWIEELLGPVPASLGISVRPVDTYDLDNFAPIETLERWKRDYVAYLDPSRGVEGKAPVVADGRSAEVVPKSVLSRIDSPLIVRLGLESPASAGSGNARREFQHVDIYFYDTMGEHFDTKAAWQQFASHVMTASGLVILVDPLASTEIRDLAGVEADRHASAQSTRDLVGRLMDQMEIDGRTEADGPATAIVLTKSDLLRPVFERDNPYASTLFPPDHSHGFNLADVESASADIEAYLRATGHDGLIKMIDQGLGRPGFFACSALGRAPGEGGRLESRPEPFRVLEPILWLLHRRGYLAAAPLLPALRERP